MLIGGCAATTGSGDVATQKRPVSGFSEIDLQGIGEVRFTVAGTESLSIEAEDNLLPLLRTEVTCGRLVISTRQPIRPTEDVVLTVTATTVDGLDVSVSGSGNVPYVGDPRLSVDPSGSGNVSGG